MKRRVGADIGFGRYKVVDDRGRRESGLSVIGDFQPLPSISGVENGKYLAVEYKDRRYYVGEAALIQSTPRATVDKRRNVSEEGLILLNTALAVTMDEPSDHIRLVVGLPVLHYEELKTDYKNIVMGQHRIAIIAPSGKIRFDKTIIVDDARVLPQPMGTYFNLLLDDTGQMTAASKLYATGKVGIIDIGYNTLDPARIDGLDFIGFRSTSFSRMGMVTAYQELANIIYQDHHVEIATEKMEAYLQQGYLSVAGKGVDLEHMKEAAFKTAAVKIASRIKSFWPDMWELDLIVLAGGGAELLGAYIKMDPEFARAIVVPEPMFANANGYLKFAKKVWKE